MPRARIGAYDHALRAIADHNVKVIIREVLTQRLCDRIRQPHSVALAYLLECCDEHLEVRGTPAQHSGDSSEPLQCLPQIAQQSDQRIRILDAGVPKNLGRQIDYWLIEHLVSHADRTGKGEVPCPIPRTRQNCLSALPTFAQQNAAANRRSSEESNAIRPSSRIRMMT